MAGRPSPSFLRPSADFHELCEREGMTVIGCCPTALSKLRLARILHHCGGRSKRQTQWVWRQASERLLLNRNNKIVSKGDEVSKINTGSGVLVVLRGLWRRGSVLEGRVQVRGGVLAAARAPLWGPGREGRRLLQRLRLPLGPRRSTGLVGLPVSRVRHSIPQRSLPGPTRTPACMHGEETGLPRRGALGI